MPRLVVVFDTNVLLSASGWGGTPRQCVELARVGTIEAVTCSAIRAELAEKLVLKAKFSPNRVNETLAFLGGFMRAIEIAGTLKGASVDPKDDMILESALLSQASHIVTGDKKHLLPMKNFRGIEIVTPAQLLTIVTARTG